ncbi:MAG: Dabb family protein, partial [Candidatus Omnitrophota bacterium]
LTFKTAKDRDAYLVHPAHKEFGQTLGTLACVDDVFVVDYWNNK